MVAGADASDRARASSAAGCAPRAARSLMSAVLHDGRPALAVNPRPTQRAAPAYIDRGHCHPLPLPPILKLKVRKRYAAARGCCTKSCFADRFAGGCVACPGRGCRASFGARVSEAGDMQPIRCGASFGRGGRCVCAGRE
jgi:hypothetical protein